MPTFYLAKDIKNTISEHYFIKGHFNTENVARI